MLQHEWQASSDPVRMFRWLIDGRHIRPKDDHWLASNRKLRLLACAGCRQIWNQLSGDSTLCYCCNGTGSRNLSYGSARFGPGDCRACNGAGHTNRFHMAVEIAEAFADDKVDIAVLNQYQLMLCSNIGYPSAARTAAWLCVHPVRLQLDYINTIMEAGLSASELADLFREVFGSEFDALALPAGPPVQLCPICQSPIKKRIDELMRGGPFGDGIGPGHTSWQINSEFGTDYDGYQVHALWRRGKPWGYKCPDCMPGPCPWLSPTVIQIAQRIYDSRDFNLMSILFDALLDADCDNTAILTHCSEQHNHVRGCWVIDLVLGKE